SQATYNRFCFQWMMTRIKIPVADRQRIDAWWAMVPGRPDVVLCQLERHGNLRSWGQCERIGDRLLFDADVVDALSDVDLRALIAHELAHVYQFAAVGFAN